MATTETQKAYYRAWYQRNKEKVIARTTLWNINHKEKHRASHQKMRHNDRLKMLLKSAQARSRVRGLEFTITKADLAKTEICPYTGITIDWTNYKHKLNGPSIDRIDNTKGYIPGNVEVVSYLGNMMKSNASPEILIHFAKEILRRHNNNNEN